MIKDPSVSFNAPFQSGQGLCYPIYAKNNYKTQTTPLFGDIYDSRTQDSIMSGGRKPSKKSQKSQKSQKGGNKIGDYSKPSTPADYPGNYYLTDSKQKN